MRQAIVLILFFISTVVLAQNANELFVTANTLYKDGKYQEAIKLYEKIEASKKVSSELYYNLGNAYYKLNKVAPSIYNYEKAILLNPLNEDAKNNLVIAKKLTLDRIEELPKSVFQRINENFLQKITYNTWAIIVLLLSFSAAILYLFFYFSDTPNKKRFFFTTSILSFILLIAAFAITYSQYNQSKNTINAIVFSEEVDVKNAPTKDADEIFMLHEGTKVKVLDTVDKWNKIKLVDGKIGWLLSENLKEL
ncbi:tetratricopeptide repeat protein [Tenacibaculum sp. AHE15PA]|uniref:tetratricopeptide repeat protein n=1 Tax=unclassified Tenacibaculum TaxID=2635139 RepID=UPI001C4EC1EA|nr:MULTISPECIES: tetratricopeptide repeat protein [unclassified Tenacibaculum]QXP73350.1 tetratricopeptide repeat protein [Tenacibaculum sp. AHE14PA]QXP74864.1 tetratricopeptide repeat protein [Tenacibaculum sp. AHE15PA]